MESSTIVGSSGRSPDVLSLSSLALCPGNNTWNHNDRLDHPSARQLASTAGQKKGKMEEALGQNQGPLTVTLDGPSPCACDPFAFPKILPQAVTSIATRSSSHSFVGAAVQPLWVWLAGKSVEYMEAPVRSSKAMVILTSAELAFFLSILPPQST